MKELVNKILNGREKIEDVYFVACGGSLVDLYPGYYFVPDPKRERHRTAAYTPLAGDEPRIPHREHATPALPPPPFPRR